MSDKAQDNSARHIGLIMDGNRRWAKAKNLPTRKGHQKGVERLREIIEAAVKVKLDYLSVYGFSVNNWRRSDKEVATLMNLLRDYIQDDLERLHDNHVRLRFLGSRNGIDEDILDMIDEASQLTQSNQGLTLAIAFNYGGRDEIIRAVNHLLKQGVREITIESIDSALDSASLPPIDLLIRTGGEQRLSDFMLWQNAYAEFLFLDMFWPDFNQKAFFEALDIYRARQRRFGCG